MRSNVNPPWLKDEALEDVQPLNSSSFASNGAANSAAQSQTPSSTLPIQEKIPLILTTLKIVTMLLCVLMAATAAIGIGNTINPLSCLL